MTETDITRFNDELLALLERHDPNEDPVRERLIHALILAQTVATAAAGELTREEFLQNAAQAWDFHWKLFHDRTGS